MNFIKQHSVFLMLLFIAGALRFWPLFDYQYTFDELSGLDRTQFSSFSELIEKGVKIDAHPAFVQVLIYYLTQFFGYTTWIIKLPFLLFSLAAMIYAYAFALRNFSKQAGLISAAVLGFSLIFVFYAPIARMYIAGVFFSLALLYYFFELVFQKRDDLKIWIGFAFFAWISALNHHINALFALTLCVAGLFFMEKQIFKKYILTCALVLLAYLPHLPITLYQLSVPGIGRENGGWLETSEFSVLLDFIKILFGTGRSYFIFLAAIFISVLIQRKIHFSKKQLLLISLFGLNYCIIYVYSVLRSPIYQHSVMLFSSTAFILVIGAMIEFKDQRIFYSVLLVFCSVLIYKTYVKKDYLHQSVKTVYEYQFERSLYYKNLYGDEKVYPIFCDADTLMQKIYFKKYQTHFDCKISSDSLISNMENRMYERQTVSGIEKVSTLRLFSEFVKALQAEYVVISSAMPSQQAIVKEYFPYLIENTQTQAVNVKVFSKREEDKNRLVPDDAVIYESDVLNPNHLLYSKSKEEVYKTSEFYLQLDSLNEFPLDAKADVNAILKREGQVLFVQADLKPSNEENATELCIAVNEKEKNTPVAYSAKISSDFAMKQDSVKTMYAEYFNGTKFKSTKDQTRLSIYVWNKLKQKSELQSFKISVIDYWPMKWQFWD